LSRSCGRCSAPSPIMASISIPYLRGDGHTEKLFPENSGYLGEASVSRLSQQSSQYSSPSSLRKHESGSI